MLAVGVEGEHSVVSSFQRPAEASAQGRTLALVRLLAQHGRARFFGEASRAVGGTVVHDQHGQARPHSGHDAADTPGFVIGRDQRQEARR